MRFDKCTRKEDPDILASGFDRKWLPQITLKKDNLLNGIQVKSWKLLTKIRISAQ